MKGIAFFQRGNTCSKEIAKLDCQHLKICFSRTTRPIWPYWHKATLGKGHSSFFEWLGTGPLSESNQCHDIIIALLNCLCWMELFSGEQWGPWASCYLTVHVSTKVDRLHSYLFTGTWSWITNLHNILIKNPIVRFLCPPCKTGHIVLQLSIGMSVGRSVGL